MAPAAKRRSTRTTTRAATRSTRQPLSESTAVDCDQAHLTSKLIEIFNGAQHASSSDSNLELLKRLYKNSEFKSFESSLNSIFKKMLQSKHTNFFKTSCDFLCKFLQHVSKLSDSIQAKHREAMENTDPHTSNVRKGSRASLAPDFSTTMKENPSKKARQARGTKRKSEEVDELIADVFGGEQSDSTSDEDSIVTVAANKRRKSLESQPVVFDTQVTNHDRLISSCVDIAIQYMKVANEDCRRNAVFFVCKFLYSVDTVDEEICKELEVVLRSRFRDRRPMIRAQAVLASRTFQANKTTQEAFMLHFYRDPELVVRKALLTIMDTKVFGYDFLVDSTRDTQETMRKSAFLRLSKIDPFELNTKQLHNVIHNGLIEREQQDFFFRTQTLNTWLPCFYDGLDLYKLTQPFDIMGNQKDVEKLLQVIFEKDLQTVENNGTTTKLHFVVEAFRERWLNSELACLPNVSQIDEKVTTIWLSLIRFCRANQKAIKPVISRHVRKNDANTSIEKILETQETDDEVVELHERLTPDLVNLIDFLKRFVTYAHTAIEDGEVESSRMEFIYQQVIEFVQTYEVVEELERKTVQEVLGNILKENLLTGSFENFIPPIISCLFKLIYSTSSNLMMNYISELINDVRSHLEDLVTSTQPKISLIHSKIAPTDTVPKSAKKVRIDTNAKGSDGLISNEQELEYRAATMALELNDLQDELEKCMKERDFDQAKILDARIKELKAERDIVCERRRSLFADLSHMSMIVETEPMSGSKLSSTLIGDAMFSEASQMSTTTDKDIRIFKNHTNELVKCFQMYYGCLRNVKINQVPLIMRNHLKSLSLESLDDWFKNDSKVRSLMVACHGLTALVDKEHAKDPAIIALLMGACFDNSSFEIRTAGFKGLVDTICQHADAQVPDEDLQKFLDISLEDYGKYDPTNLSKGEFEFITAVIEGAAKLFFSRRISSPDIFSHLILWWYHPRTPSRLKQFIGVFMPTFVNDMSRMISPKQAEEAESYNTEWLRNLLGEVFVISIVKLYDYISGPGYNIMGGDDMLSLINFLCNLIPITFHEDVARRVDKTIDDLGDNRDNRDLLKYLKQSRSSLNTKTS